MLKLTDDALVGESVLRVIGPEPFWPALLDVARHVVHELLGDHSEAFGVVEDVARVKHLAALCGAELVFLRVPASKPLLDLDVARVEFTLASNLECVPDCRDRHCKSGFLVVEELEPNARRSRVVFLQFMSGVFELAEPGPMIALKYGFLRRFAVETSYS